MNSSIPTGMKIIGLIAINILHQCQRGVTLATEIKTDHDNYINGIQSAYVTNSNTIILHPKNQFLQNTFLFSTYIILPEARSNQSILSVADAVDFRSQKRLNQLT